MNKSWFARKIVRNSWVMLAVVIFLMTFALEILAPGLTWVPRIAIALCVGFVTGVPLARFEQLEKRVDELEKEVEDLKRTQFDTDKI